MFKRCSDNTYGNSLSYLMYLSILCKWNFCLAVRLLCDEHKEIIYFILFYFKQDEKKTSKLLFSALLQ